MAFGGPVLGAVERLHRTPADERPLDAARERARPDEPGGRVEDLGQGRAPQAGRPSTQQAGLEGVGPESVGLPGPSGAKTSGTWFDVEPCG